jgi:hypothetical protein
MYGWGLAMLAGIIRNWIKTEMNIVLKAPGAFILTLIIAVSIAYFAAHWRYDRIIDNCRSSLQAQEERHRTVLLKKNQISSLETIPKPKLVTISSNEITLTGPGTYLVDTENKANSDDLKKIYGLSEGNKVTLKAADNDRTIVIKKGHYLKMQADFSLNNEDDFIILISKGSNICAQYDREDIGD